MVSLSMRSGYIQGVMTRAWLVFYKQTGTEFQGELRRVSLLAALIHDEKETCYWGKLQTSQGTPQFGG